MALITCSGCGNRISSRAGSCPKCGRPNESVAQHTQTLPPGAAAPSQGPPVTAPQQAPPEPPPAQDPAQETSPQLSVDQPLAGLSPEESSEDWYYVSSAGRCGPVSLRRLRDLAAQGELEQSVLVWKTGLPDWIPLSSYQPGSSPTEQAATAPATVRAASRLMDWVLALSPAWGVAAQLLATELWLAALHRQLGYYAQFWWITVVAILAAGYAYFAQAQRRGAAFSKGEAGLCLLLPPYHYLLDHGDGKKLKHLGIWAAALAGAICLCLYLNTVYARLSYH